MSLRNLQIPTAIARKGSFAAAHGSMPTPFRRQSHKPLVSEFPVKRAFI